MKLFVAACLVAVAAAGRLDNTYLPPSGARGAGGSSNFLGTPFRSTGSAFGSFGSSSSSFKSSSFPVAPAPAASSFGVAGGYKSTSYSGGPHIGIVRYDNDNDGLGRYQFAYETENRISAQETGELRNAGSQNEANTVHGSYTYTGDDGVTITVNYVADENGFQPSGAHLPTPPPIPEAILKSLQYNAAHGDGDDSGQYQGSSAGYSGQYRGSSAGYSGQYQGSSAGISGQYQAPAFSKQYIAPNKQQSFSSQTGYQY